MKLLKWIYYYSLVVNQNDSDFMFNQGLIYEYEKINCISFFYYNNSPVLAVNQNQDQSYYQKCKILSWKIKVPYISKDSIDKLFVSA